MAIVPQGCKHLPVGGLLLATSLGKLQKLLGYWASVQQRPMILYKSRASRQTSQCRFSTHCTLQNISIDCSAFSYYNNKVQDGCRIVVYVISVCCRYVLIVLQYWDLYMDASFKRYNCRNRSLE